MFSNRATFLQKSLRALNGQLALMSSSLELGGVIDIRVRV